MRVSTTKLGELAVAWAGKHVQLGVHKWLAMVQKKQEQLSVQNIIAFVLQWTAQLVRHLFRRLHQLGYQGNIPLHAPPPKVPHEGIEMGQFAPSLAKITESHQIVHTEANPVLWLHQTFYRFHGCCQFIDIDVQT